jgi:rRNA maturation endonuclease Nob1
MYFRGRESCSLSLSINPFMSKYQIKSDSCLNCSTSLRPEDNYCPNCGQENKTHKISVSHIILETFEDFFHFDTKLWNTIKITFTRPGKITTDYLEGKRARYVPPVKLYIFISFIFFLLLGKLSDHTIENSKNKHLIKQGADKTMSITLNELLGKEKIYYSKDSSDVRMMEFDYTSKDSLQKDLNKLKSAPDSIIDKMLIKEEIDTTAASRKNLRNMLALIPEHSQALDSAKFSINIFNKVEFTSKEEYDKFKEKIHDYSNEQIDSLLISKGEKVTWFNRQLLKKLGKYDWKDKDDIKEITHAIIKSISLTMFVMMPLTAILLLFIFYRRKYYYEHLIFSIHIHTIFFLILSFVLAIQVFISDSFGGKLWVWAFLICLIYLISSLKHNYMQSWSKTITKFLLMSIPYFIISLSLTLFAVLYGFLA